MTTMTSRGRWTSRAAAPPVKKRNERTPKDLIRYQMEVTKKKIATWILEAMIVLAAFCGVAAAAWMAVEALESAHVF